MDSKQKAAKPEQLELSLDLGLERGERVIKHTRLVAPSVRNAWYELFLVRLPHGFLISKVSGATGQGNLTETWFRRQKTDTESKFDKIVLDKTNPLRRSPRKYVVACSTL